MPVCPSGQPVKVPLTAPALVLSMIVNCCPTVGVKPADTAVARVAPLSDTLPVAVTWELGDGAAEMSSMRKFVFRPWDPLVRPKSPAKIQVQTLERSK